MLHEDYLDTSVAKVGDLVRGDYVMDMMNCLPPVLMRTGCSQVGEPYSHATDGRTGKWRPTFLTFHLYERNGDAWGHDSLWAFDGACFAYGNENMCEGFACENREA